jgi:hypothetical protein
VQGTNNGVSTDFDGKFQLSTARDILFSFDVKNYVAQKSLTVTARRSKSTGCCTRYTQQEP